MDKESIGILVTTGGHFHVKSSLADDLVNQTIAVYASRKNFQTTFSDVFKIVTI